MIGYAAELDGEVAGEVIRGQSTDFVIAPGEHQVRLRIVGSWTGKPSKIYGSRIRPIALEEGELVEVICGPNGPAILGILGLLQFRRYINLERPCDAFAWIDQTGGCTLPPEQVTPLR